MGKKARKLKKDTKVVENKKPPQVVSEVHNSDLDNNNSELQSKTNVTTEGNIAVYSEYKNQSNYQKLINEASEILSSSPLQLLNLAKQFNVTVVNTHTGPRTELTYFDGSGQSHIDIANKQQRDHLYTALTILNCNYDHLKQSRYDDIIANEISWEILLDKAVTKNWRNSITTSSEERKLEPWEQLLNARYKAVCKLAENHAKPMLELVHNMTALELDLLKAFKICNAATALDIAEQSALPHTSLIVKHLNEYGNFAAILDTVNSPVFEDNKQKLSIVRPFKQKEEKIVATEISFDSYVPLSTKTTISTYEDEVDTCTVENSAPEVQTTGTVSDTEDLFGNSLNI